MKKIGTVSMPQVSKGMKDFDIVKFVTQIEFLKI